MTEPISAPHVHVILMRALGPHYVRAPFERYLRDAETPGAAVAALDDCIAFLARSLAHLETQRGETYVPMARRWCEERLALAEHAKACLHAAFPERGEPSEGA